MSRFPLRSAALLAGLAGIVCGVAGPAAATEPVPATTPAAPVVVASPPIKPAPPVKAAPPIKAAPPVKLAAKRAIAVVVVRTGGLRGGQSVFTQVGSVNRQQAAVLRLAGSPAFQALRPKYVPAKPGADRYTYRIEAGYRDNSKKRVLVVDGAPGTPQVALDVIRLMTNMDAPDLADLSGLPVRFPPGFPFN